MASTAVYIANTLDAIATGVEIPGKFSEDRTEFRFPTLKYVGSRGATHHWSIRVRLLKDGYVPITDEMLDSPVPDLEGYKAEIMVESKQVGGKTRDVVPTYVSVGKNLGKKNATNPITQAIRNALGLYNKQKKRGDIVVDGEDEAADDEAADDEAADDGAEEVDNGEVSGAFDPMPPPMLVKKIGDSQEATLTPDKFEDGITAQRKFNGVHLVVFVRTGGGGRKTLTRYSRTGTEYPGQEHIVAEITPMIVNAPPIAAGKYGVPAAPSTDRDRRILDAYGALPDKPGDPVPYFAGELYQFGKSLNWISGQARRGDDDSQLEFHIFDVFFPYAKAAGHDMESRHRQQYLQAFFAKADADGRAHPHIVPVENFPVHSMDELTKLAKSFVRSGYEGAIARKDNAGYRYSYSNYHAPNAVKIKPKFDAEFPVVGFTQGTRGKDVGALILICKVPNPVNPRDDTFSVVPKDMTYKDRYTLFRRFGQIVDGPGGVKMTRFDRDIKGLPVTVEYAEISAKTGKPLQAKALLFRTYESGPGADPIRQILNE